MDSNTIKCQTEEPELDANPKGLALHGNSLEDESFVLVHVDKEEEIEKHLESLNNHIEELEKRNKKLENDYEKLEKRHGDLLKLMNELLKIKPSNNDVGLENLEDIRQRITQILYNEVRRHTVFSFTPILGSYNIFPIIKSTSVQDVTSSTDVASSISNNVD